MDEQDFDAEAVDPEFLERLNSLSSEEEEARVRALRVGLEDYELDEEDIQVL
jgi:GTP-binding protein